MNRLRHFLFLAFVFCIVLISIAPSIASTDFLTVVGAPPVCTSASFVPWYKDALKATMDSVPIDRATKVYFSQRGNDSGDGSNAVYFGSLTACSWNSGTLTLTKTAAFTSYTWQAGDTIKITGGTAITPGIYAIASKTDSDNIVLTSSIGTTASDVTVSGGWYKTLVKAQAIIDAASSPANMTLYFRAGEIWRETTTKTWNIASGGATTSIQMATITDTYSIGSTVPTDLITNAIVTLNGGTSQTATITNYTSAGLLTVNSVNGTTHTSVSITEPVGLYLWKPSLSIASFGPQNGRKPMFQAWISPYNVNSFSRTSGTTFVWERAETNPVSWFREENEIFEVWHHMPSVATMDAAPEAGGPYWFWDKTAGKIYVRPRKSQSIVTAGGLTGSGHSYQAVYENAVRGIFISDVDGVRVDGIDISGYGCSMGGTTQSLRTYGIQGIVSGTNLSVISRCTVTYAFNHTIGVLGTSSGGQVVYYQNIYGWGPYNGDSVTYTPYGNNVSLFHECVCLGSCLPDGIQPNSSGGTGSPMISHSTFGQITSGNWSGTTCTVGTAPGRCSAIYPGAVITLSGGTTETKTVSSYDSNTGVITWTTSMNGTTHTTTNTYYDNRFYMAFGCRNIPGPYQSNGSCNPPANAARFTDLANCTSFLFDCSSSTISGGSEANKNYYTAGITTPTAGDTTLTLTTPITTSTFPQIPQSNIEFELGGGSSAPELVRASAYNSGTGVFTLLSGTPVVGSSRSYVRIPVGLSNTGNTFSPTVTSGNSSSGGYTCAIINCKIPQVLLFSQQGGASPAWTSSNTYYFLMINCVLTYDSTVSPVTSGQGAVAFINSSGLKAKLYNCTIAWFAPPRSLTGFESAAMASGSSTPTNVLAYNCIFNSNANINGAQGAFASTGGTSTVGLNNDATLMKNNLYANISVKTGVPGYSNDPYGQEFNGFLPIDHHPERDDTRFVTGHFQLVEGYPLQYDIQLNPRSYGAIGPYEPVQSPPIVGRGRRIALIPMNDKNNFARVGNHTVLAGGR